jgi:hypothetical protein
VAGFASLVHEHPCCVIVYGAKDVHQVLALARDTIIMQL